MMCTVTLTDEEGLRVEQSLTVPDDLLTKATASVQDVVLHDIERTFTDVYKRICYLREAGSV